MRHSFVSKAAEVPHIELFTELSVIGAPGKRHVFLAKELAEEERVGGGTFFKAQKLNYEKVLQEDKEMLETITQAFISGVFD